MSVGPAAAFSDMDMVLAIGAATLAFGVLGGGAGVVLAVAAYLRRRCRR